MAMISNLKSLTDIAKIATGAKHNILTVPLSDVVPKEQVRKKFRNIEELAVTMKTEGQQSPIIVSPKNSDGKYVIQKGERRWRALNVAGIPTIDIIVRAAPKNLIEEVKGELIENIQRDDLMAMEIADGMRTLLNEGLSRKQISEELGKSPTYVSIMLSVREAQPPVLKLYEDDLVSDPHTLYTLKQIYQEDAVFGEKVCAQVRKQGGITRKKARDILAALKSGDDPENPAPTRQEAVNAIPGALPAESPLSPATAEAVAAAPTPQSGARAPAVTPQAAQASDPRASSQEGEQTQRHSEPRAQATDASLQHDTGSADTASAAVTASPSKQEQPAMVRIKVEVLSPDGSASDGELRLDRADSDFGYGWVLLDGDAEATRVEVDRIRILEVRPA